jgi:hypothetical protein
VIGAPHIGGDLAPCEHQPESELQGQPGGEHPTAGQSGPLGRRRIS